MSADAVEPELVETVARSFERDMVDACGGKLVQLAVQGHGVGRGEAARPRDPRPEHADGADARRAQAQPRPNLTREHRDRGLAVGAGDRHDEFRLGRVESRRYQRKAAARIGIGNDRYGGVDVGGAVGKDGGSAMLHRVGDEAAAIGFISGERREQEARLHGPGIRGQADDLGVALPGREAKGLSAFHYLS